MRLSAATGTPVGGPEAREETLCEAVLFLLVMAGLAVQEKGFAWAAANIFLQFLCLAAPVHTRTALRKWLGRPFLTQRTAPRVWQQGPLLCLTVLSTLLRVFAICSSAQECVPRWT